MPDGRVHDTTVVVISSIFEGENLQKVMDEIISSMPENVFLQPGKLNDVEIVLNVMILYDTYTCSFSVLPSHASFFAKNNIEMEFSLYPTNFEG